MAATSLGSLLLAAALAMSGGDEARLYGRVTTVDGVVVEGYLRWDRNEASRADFLDAAMEIPREVLDEAERLDPAFAAEMRRRRSIVAFGRRIRWEVDDIDGPPTEPSALRFAHIASLEPMDGRRARVTLLDGQVIELEGTSTDIGPGMRDLLVDTGSGPYVSVDWHDLERVELLPPPPDAPAPREAPLHGTVRTHGGLELTGWIAWDRDEVLESDVLDGREGATEHEIPFSEIVRIAPEGRRSARVTLRSGVARVLRGSNDVDRDNRGIEVADPAMGRAIVSWEDLEEVRFHPRTSGEPELSAKAGGEHRSRLGPLRGTVYARDGRVLEGEIRWGHEEERRWEVLDGWTGETRLAIELGAIEQIRPAGPDESVVSLFDGRVFRLEGTDDVGEGHRGVFVKPDGRPRRLVRWVDVDRVLFER